MLAAFVFIAIEYLDSRAKLNRHANEDRTHMEALPPRLGIENSIAQFAVLKYLVGIKERHGWSVCQD